MRFDPSWGNLQLYTFLLSADSFVSISDKALLLRSLPFKFQLLEHSIHPIQNHGNLVLDVTTDFHKT